MIQRKQTLYLLVAAILAVVCLLVRLTWLDGLQLAVAAVATYTIFQYKKRKQQAMLCVGCLILILAWYVGLAVLQGVPNTIDAVPMVEAILIALARKGILDDEKLVRAADRIR